MNGKSTQSKAFLFDMLIGLYLAVSVERVVWQTVVMASPPTGFSLLEGLICLACSVIFAVVCLVANASPTGAALGWLLPEGKKRAFVYHVLWWLIVVSILSAWTATKVSLEDLFSSGGLQAAQKLASSLLRPIGILFEPVSAVFGNSTFTFQSWSQAVALEWKILPEAIAALIETVYLALLATALALPLSFVLSFLSAKNIMKGRLWSMTVYSVIRGFANFTRSIEPLIWAIVFSVWVGIGPFAGMLALAIHTVSSLVKQYSEQIETIDHGPVEAIESVGAHPIQVVWFAVVPQVVLPFLSFTVYRWDINVRMSTVIGLVGGGGIGTLLTQAAGLSKWSEVGVMVFLIAAVVWVMDVFSSTLRERLA